MRRALVLFKRLLDEAVEGECSYSAIEMRGGDAPRAVGAAPAGEVVAFDPDQTFIHTPLPFCVCLGFELGRGGRNTATDRARKVNSCPPESIFHGFAVGESN